MAAIACACGAKGEDDALEQRREATPEVATPVPPAGSSTPHVDPRTGLLVTTGFELVASTCTPCHSGKLVAQNRGTRRDWDERLRWMQANHNLWELPATTRAQILDYLATNYGIDDDAARHSRRRPLPDHLLPPTRAQLASQPAAPMR